jgi:hypothetical protein
MAAAYSVTMAFDAADRVLRQFEVSAVASSVEVVKLHCNAARLSLLQGNPDRTHDAQFRQGLHAEIFWIDENGAVADARDRGRITTQEL